MCCISRTQLITTRHPRHTEMVYTLWPQRADLVDVLSEVRNASTVGPVLVHVITEKGRGYKPAETASDKMHGVVKYNVVTGKQHKPTGAPESYTNIFADALVAEAEADSRVMAIHAAMAGGTGLSRCGHPSVSLLAALPMAHSIAVCARDGDSVHGSLRYRAQLALCLSQWHWLHASSCLHCYFVIVRCTAILIDCMHFCSAQLCRQMHARSALSAWSLLCTGRACGACA